MGSVRVTFPPWHRPHRRVGFSMLELAIVLAVMAVIAAIAIPRMSAASHTAMVNTLTADTRRLQTAIDLYIAEHQGLSPAQDPDGSYTTDPSVFALRLTGWTNESGDVVDQADPAALFGPYIRAIPRNPFAECHDVRLTTLPGRGDCSFWFNRRLNAIRPDHAFGPADHTDHASGGPVGGWLRGTTGSRVSASTLDTPPDANALTVGGFTAD
jgi:prepilin-type N-terminal cleavage/methylation domain-containing protein